MIINLLATTLTAVAVLNVLTPSVGVLNTPTTSNRTLNASSQPPILIAQTLPCNAVTTVSPPFTAQTVVETNVRAGRSSRSELVKKLSANQTFRFDAWGYGDEVMDTGYSPPRPDRRWYKLQNENGWVASAVVKGDAPNSSPTCIPTGGGYFDNLASWTDTQWENTINSANALNFINNNPNSDIGRIYRDLSNDLFGKYFPITGAYISDDYYRETGGRLGYHGGIDLGAPKGTEVKAMVDGTVVIAQRNSNGTANGDGILTIKAANGANYIFMHLSEIRVAQGQPVKKGTVVGKTGAMGGGNPNAFAPHLHYEVARPDFPWGALQRPAAKTKDDFRKRTFNPLKNYWELRRR